MELAWDEGNKCSNKQTADYLSAKENGHPQAHATAGPASFPPGVPG